MAVTLHVLYFSYYRFSRRFRFLSPPALSNSPEECNIFLLKICSLNETPSPEIGRVRKKWRVVLTHDFVLKGLRCVSKFRNTVQLHLWQLVIRWFIC